jgi:hypothetical protein
LSSYAVLVPYTPTPSKPRRETASTREFLVAGFVARAAVGKEHDPDRTDYPGPVPIEEDYFIWGPANLIYYPEKQNEKNIQPGRVCRPVEPLHDRKGPCQMAKANLITPYGGKLVNLVLTGKEREEALAQAAKLPSIKITMRNLCDLELIATGGFSP